MKGYPLVPGVKDAGHMTKGFWHPGPVQGCPKCEPPPPPPAPSRPPPPPPRSSPVQLVEVKVEVTIPFRNRGSDCLTGKKQFVSRDAALAAATALRRQHGRRTIHPFKCSWCLLWHTGNKDRGDASKNRNRR